MMTKKKVSISILLEMKSRQRETLALWCSLPLEDYVVNWAAFHRMALIMARETRNYVKKNFRSWSLEECENVVFK